MIMDWLWELGFNTYIYIYICWEREKVFSCERARAAVVSDKFQYDDDEEFKYIINHSDVWI